MRVIEVTPELMEWLLESLVISYEHHRADGKFVIVTDFWDKSPGSDREFIRITFRDVRDFVREPGGNLPLQRFVDNYSLRERTGADVLQRASMRRLRAGWSIRFAFGYGFGGFRFKFSHATAKVRGSIAREVDGEWRYYSLETGEPFDFHAPFG